MKIHLAPMEGVVDPLMREILTEIGGIDRCITEFIRVTDQLLPAHVFYKFAPELHSQSQTAAGVPLYLQLLGGQVKPLAENAARAWELGACGIDLNFGCPAKTVNRHDGGASLLKCPQRLFDIISGVKAQLPPEAPVTAKIRLGFDTPDFALDIAQAANDAGANLLTVHARTKLDAYKPPARWEWIARIRESVGIPVMANGDIWTVEDYYRCLEVTGCEDVMIGRGAIADPFLCYNIKASLQKTEPIRPTERDYLVLVLRLFCQSVEQKSPTFALARSKQWLRQLTRWQPGVSDFFEVAKKLTEATEFDELLQQRIASLDSASPQECHVLSRNA